MYEHISLCFSLASANHYSTDRKEQDPTQSNSNSDRNSNVLGMELPTIKALFTRSSVVSVDAHDRGSSNVRSSVSVDTDKNTCPDIQQEQGLEDIHTQL